MDLAHPLAVITPTVDGDVLAVLAGADAGFTGREVHRLVGRYSEAGVRNVLGRLVEQGIVLVERVGPSYRYRLNRDHLAAPHVVALARLRAELLERLRARFATWAPAPKFAALFGSAARGDMETGSDIDLLIVRPDPVDPDDGRWTGQVDALSRDVSRWTGNDTRPLEYDESELRQALRRRAPVLDAIRNEGLPLSGPDEYLRGAGRVAGRRRPEGRPWLEPCGAPRPPGPGGSPKPGSSGRRHRRSKHQRSPPGSTAGSVGSPRIPPIRSGAPWAGSEVHPRSACGSVWRSSRPIPDSGGLGWSGIAEVLGHRETTGEGLRPQAKPRPARAGRIGPTRP